MQISHYVTIVCYIRRGESKTVADPAYKNGGPN
jgi:hypothetical protein